MLRVSAGQESAPTGRLILSVVAASVMNVTPVQAMMSAPRRTVQLALEESAYSVDRKHP